MLNRFLSKFRSTDRELIDQNKDYYQSLPKNLFDLIERFGGMTFNNGLFRIHSFKSSIEWTNLITDFFIDFKNVIYPFGFDWMGNQFCLSTESQFKMYLFDPSTTEALEIQNDVFSFLENDMVDHTDVLISDNLFYKLLKMNDLKSIGFNDCLSNKLPYFLGGKYEDDNYELSDMEVYWHLNGQIYHQIKDLPEGTEISEINYEPFDPE